MTDPEKLEQILPLALEWSRAQEALILQHGMPLSAKQAEDALRAGVREPAKVRVLVVDRITAPENAALAEAALNAQIITEASRAATFGHGIIIRANSWQDRELLVHQLVHVAQAERCGSLEAYVTQYLTDRATCAEFTAGSLEDEARTLAHRICTTEEPGSTTR